MNKAPYPTSPRGMRSALLVPQEFKMSREYWTKEHSRWIQNLDRELREAAQRCYELDIIPNTVVIPMSDNFRRLRDYPSSIQDKIFYYNRLYNEYCELTSTD